MKEVTTTGSERTIGLDLGDQYTEACVLDDRGEVVETFRVRPTWTAMEGALSRFESSRVVLEVGTHSPWGPRRNAQRWRTHEVIESANGSLEISGPRASPRRHERNHTDEKRC